MCPLRTDAANRTTVSHPAATAASVPSVAQARAPPSRHSPTGLPSGPQAPSAPVEFPPQGSARARFEGIRASLSPCACVFARARVRVCVCVCVRVRVRGHVPGA
eukprot:12506521-Alexandrium_andersonii.AAC.1